VGIAVPVPAGLVVAPAEVLAVAEVVAAVVAGAINPLAQCFVLKL
jgi:hypothetical protein